MYGQLYPVNTAIIEGLRDSIRLAYKEVDMFSFTSIKIAVISESESVEGIISTCVVQE